MNESAPLPFLSDSEIASLCDGLRLPGAQCKYLARLGLLVNRKPNGKPLVARSEFERVKALQNPQPPAVVPWSEAEIVGPWMYLRVDWKNTPLGRWQQRQREAEAEVRAANPPALPLSEGEQRLREHERLNRAAEQRAALVRHHTAKRRTAKLQRIPPWADLAAIKAIYDEAHAKTRATGVPHHVDHDIPLQGKLVSGLHVHNNLQILTGSENSKKHNRFEIEA